jgi:hypothetical protein
MLPSLANSNPGYAGFSASGEARSITPGTPLVRSTGAVSAPPTGALPAPPLDGEGGWLLPNGEASKGRHHHKVRRMAPSPITTISWEGRKAFTGSSRRPSLPIASRLRCRASPTSERERQLGSDVPILFIECDRILHLGSPTGGEIGARRRTGVYNVSANVVAARCGDRLRWCKSRPGPSYTKVLVVMSSTFSCAGRNGHDHLDRLVFALIVPRARGLVTHSVLGQPFRENRGHAVDCRHGSGGAWQLALAVILGQRYRVDDLTLARICRRRILKTREC